MPAEFTKKPIASAATLGDRLRALREEMRATPEDVEATTGVPVKYILALEAGEYAALPGDVYIRTYLRKYAHYLEVNEESVLRRYDGEQRAHRLDLASAKTLTSPVHRSAKRRLVIEPKLLRRIGFAVVALAALTYLGFAVARIAKPPALNVDAPADNLTVSDERLTVQGRTERETRVLVNGEEVTVDRSGQFEAKVNLRPGVNTLEITAVKKNGKSSTVTRSVRLTAEAPSS